MRHLARLWTRLADWLFPPRCAVCGAVIRIGAALCDDCMDELPAALWLQPRCSRCGKPAGGCICGHYAPPAFDCCTAAILYDNRTAAAIDLLKRTPNSPIAGQLAQLLAQAVREQMAKEHFCCVTAVPMHPAQQQRRGHNQAETLARALAKQLGLAFRPAPLLQGEKKQDQHSLTLQQRIQNAAQSYTLAPNAHLSGNVLLVDDVLTSAATLQSCAALLRQAGAARVCCATAATTPRRVAQQMASE